MSSEQEKIYIEISEPQEGKVNIEIYAPSLVVFTDEQLEQIKQKLSHQLPQIKENYHIIQLGIFGSYVRGEATNHSDLDILVEFDPEAKFGLLTFCELENYLSELLAIKVDLVMKDGLRPNIGGVVLQEVVYL